MPEQSLKQTANLYNKHLRSEWVRPCAATMQRKLLVTVCVMGWSLLMQLATARDPVNWAALTVPDDPPLQYKGDVSVCPACCQYQPSWLPGCMCFLILLQCFIGFKTFCAALSTTHNVSFEHLCILPGCQSFATTWQSQATCQGVCQIQLRSMHIYSKEVTQAT